MENNNANIQNQERNIPYSSPRKSDYYTTTGKKIGDFLLGFFGIIILYSIFWAVSSLYPSFGLLADLFIWIIWIVVLILFFKTDRRFIAKGIISGELIRILVVLVFSGFFWLVMVLTGEVW